uniref:DNA topoisomerase (ATP-hydrolyzing) n=1 Tax=Romanomermis culicivorax TaxID=13658 RepID=A0A915KC24_ROMCU
MDGKHDIVIEITELPIGTWTNSYKESVLEPMVTGGEKSKEQKIQSYKEYQTDTTVRFLVYVTKNQMDALEAEGLYKAFKLQSVVATSNMILFDACGCLKRYDTAGDIIRDFYPVRLAMYEKRKEYMLSFLKADVCRLTNMARFIVEKITNVIKTHCKVGELAKILVSRKYDPDPIKRWKNEQKKMSKSEDIEEEDAEVDAENTESVVSSSKISTSEIKNFRSDYGYLVNMPILNETEEFKDHLLKDCDKKQKELELLANKTIKQFWLDDLDTFMEKLDKQEAEELADSRNLKKKSGGAGMKETGKTSKSKREEIKLQNVRLVEPIIDASLKDKFDKADQLKENRVKGIKRPKKDAEFKKVANKQPTNAKEEGDNSIIVDDDENRSDDELQDILNDSNIFQSEKAKEILSSTEKPVKAQRKKVATNGGLKQRTMHEFSGKGAAKKKATSKIESDDENIFKIEESDDDDDDFVTSLKKRENSKQPEIAKKGAPSRKKRIEDDNEEENRDDVKKGPRLKKQKTSPKKTKQTKKANSDSEAESINDDDTPLPVSRPARARKNIVYNFDEDEDDDENLGNDNTRKNRILDDDSDDVESFEPSIDDDSDFEGFSSKAKKSRK